MLNDIRLPGGLGLRPATDGDRAFMRQLFASTREFLQQLPLPKQHVDALVEQQYRLQQAAYAEQWPDADTLIIRLFDQAIGKVILDESETAFHVVDIALKPAMRGKGYGTSVLRALQVAARSRGLPVRLTVDRQNPAAGRLYRTLGFEVTRISDTHQTMSWSPPAHTTLQE